MAASIEITLTMSRWLRDSLFASVALLQAVEDADRMLVTEDILERAAELRDALER